MRRALLILLAVAPIGFATTVSAQSPSVSTSEIAPSGSFTVDADWTEQLGSIIDGSDLNCKSGRKTYDKASDVLSAVIGNLPKVLTSKIAFTCNPVLALADKTFAISGTVSSDAYGFTNGVFALSCNLRSNLSVAASVAIGKTAVGFANVRVTSATPMPIACGFAATDKVDEVETSLKGTIEGWASVGDAATNDCTTPDAGCIPFSVSSAKVTITEATGALAGYIGSGTYSFADTFTLKSLATPVNTLKARYPQLASTSTGAPQTGSMSITLKAGTGAAVILRPVPTRPLTPAVLSPLTPFVVAAPAGSVCKMRLTLGSKKWESAQGVTVSQNGRVLIAVSKTEMSTKVASKLSIRLTSKPVVTATAVCTGDGATYTAVEKVKLSL